MINQLTVFLENSEGRLGALCQAMGDAGINMHALTIAEVADYGVVRILCADPAEAEAALDKAGFRAMQTPVIAILIPDEPGSLARVLAALQEAKVNVEYGYCFSQSNLGAVDVLKVKDIPAASQAIEAAGFTLLSHDDLFQS